MQLSAIYTHSATGETAPVSVAFAPDAPERRSPQCLGFTFGSASHPDDFRCQTCHHFAWSSHEPRGVWVGASDAPEQLALAAMDAVLAGATATPAMMETLRVWVRDLRKRSTIADEIVVDRFVLTFGL